MLEAAAAGRPGVERAHRARLPGGHLVALAELRRGVAVEAQDLGERRAGLRADRAVAGRRRGELGDGAHPDRVVVAAGQQRLAGRRAHRGGVEARELEPGRASRSAVGVAIAPPNALEAPKPTSSSSTMRTLGAPAGGRSGSSDGAAAGALEASPLGGTSPGASGMGSTLRSKDSDIILSVVIGAIPWRHARPNATSSRIGELTRRRRRARSRVPPRRRPARP